MLALLLLSMTLFSSPSAAVLTTTYNHGPISMSSTIQLYHTIEPLDNIAHFGVVFHVPNDPKTAVWVGLGIGEPTSGGMKGADIVSCEFSSPSSTQPCTINDRYVPYTSVLSMTSPNGLSASEMGHMYPLIDACDQQDWVLVSSFRNDSVIAFEVQRPLDHYDLNDRPISPGLSSVLVAHGDMGHGMIRFHGTDVRKRAAKKIVLYEDPSMDVQDEHGDHEKLKDETQWLDDDIVQWPQDTHFTVDVTQKGFHVLHGKSNHRQKFSSIGCTATKVELVQGFPNAMIIAAEPIIKVTQSSDYVDLNLSDTSTNPPGGHGQNDDSKHNHGDTGHGDTGHGEDNEHHRHGRLERIIKYVKAFVCSSEGYAQRLLDESMDCTSKVFGPVGNPDSGCTTFIYGYSNEPDHNWQKRMILPRDAGILINDRRQFIVLETVYYNPEDTPFVLDFSGMRLYMTRVPRLHAVGSLIIGDAFSSRAPGRVHSGFKYQHTCPYICTQNMSESEVELIGTYSQMHDAGQAVHTNIYDRDNVFKETVTQIDFWSAWLPGRIGAGTDGVTNELNRRHIKLHRGDQITITCTYDTTERRQIEFGSWAVDEVCVQFIHYFPVTVDVETGHEMNLCAFQALERGAVYGTSICADNGHFREFLYAPYRFKFAVNPLFNDYAGVPHPFATAALAANSCPSGKRKPSRGGDLAELDMGNASPQPDSGEHRSGKKGKSKRKKGASKNKTDDLDDQLDDLDDNRHKDDDDTDESVVKSTGEPGLTVAFGSDSGGSCFPAGAMVTVKCTTSACSTMKKRMDEIKVGDHVQVGGKDRYSPVFMFSHQDGQHRGQFVRVHMGRRTVVMSHGHMVYVRGGARGDNKVVRASDVRVGYELICVKCEEHDRNAGLVTAVDVVWDTGLFNPQTIDGDILVNGVLATTFTDAVDMRTASALLSPIRALFRAIVMKAARSSSMMEWHIAFADWVCRALPSLNIR